MSVKIEIKRGTENVFKDMGLPDHNLLLIKTDLIINLKKLMRKYGMSQRKVAKILGSDQPTISKVLNGKMESISIDKLIEWNMKLDQDIQIGITNRLQVSSIEEKLKDCAA